MYHKYSIYSPLPPPPTYQRYDERFLEAQGTSYGEHGVQAGEHGGKQDDLANPGIHREVRQVVAQRRELLTSIQCILRKDQDELPAIL